jgi:hypothetical protein
MPKDHKEILKKLEQQSLGLQVIAKAAKTATDNLKKLQEEAKKLKGEASAKDADFDA